MPVFFKDRAGVYRGCNEAFTALLGRTPAELKAAALALAFELILAAVQRTLTPRGLLLQRATARASA